MLQHDSVQVARGVFVAPTAYLGGNLFIGEDSTVMHHVVIRADVSPVRIGARVNVQDGTIIHTRHGVPLTIGDDVGIGHRAVVHCKQVGPHTLLGTGCIILDDCEVGRDCLVAAGALLTPGSVVPDGKVVMGVPGRVVRDVTAKDLEAIDYVVQRYVELGRAHAAGRFLNRASSSAS